MKFNRALLLGLLTGIVAGIWVFIRFQREQALATPEKVQENIEIERAQETALAVSVETKPAAAPATPKKKDRLEVIRGIGPVYAQRLNQAGVYTFADLSAQSPENILASLGKTRLPVDPEAWIQEALERLDGA